MLPNPAPFLAHGIIHKSAQKEATLQTLGGKSQQCVLVLREPHPGPQPSICVGI